jgi:hypothetical protein
MTENFQRESRYIVIKISDAQAALSERSQGELNSINESIDDWRHRQGKHRLAAVVVEHDWPEYEAVWEMLEARVMGKPAPAAQCPNCNGTTSPHALDPEWLGRCECTPPAQPAQQDRVRELECVIADLTAECKELRAAQPAPVQEPVEEMHDALCPALNGGRCECANPTVTDKAWAQFCGGIGRGNDAPYPGMIEAFEAYYSQSFVDKDWRAEASVWAASWGAAKRHTTPPAAQPEERNFCSRCGKRTADLTAIHTCTPPQENTLDTAPPAQPAPTVQEPVAWMHTMIDDVVIGHRPSDLHVHPDRWMPLYKDPTPCQTCEALARTVMMDQTAHDTAPPAAPVEREPDADALDGDIDLFDDARAILETIVHDQPADLFRDARALIPKLRARIGMPPIINFTTPPAQPAPVQDIPDLIAGALGVSRGTAYDLMREALKEAAPVQEPVAWPEHEFIQWGAKKYGPLVQAAINLLAEIDGNHDSKSYPQKYGVPYGAVNTLRDALTATPPAHDVVDIAKSLSGAAHQEARV